MTSNRARAWLAATGWALAAAVSVQGQSAPTAQAVETGRELFTAHCATCHGRSARGDGPVADAMRVPPTDLTALALQNGGVFPEARAARMIKGPMIGAHGSLEMPVWGDAFRRREGLSDQAIKDRIAALVAYLRSVQQRPSH